MTTKVWKMRVLVVEDDKDINELSTSFFKFRGHEAIGAYNGAQGLRLFESYKPDAVVLDFGLPDMNGYEWAKIVRSPPYSSRISIHLVSAYDNLDDMFPDFSAVFNTYHVKPVLLDVIGELFECPAGPQAERNAPKAVEMTRTSTFFRQVELLG